MFWLHLAQDLFYDNESVQGMYYIKEISSYSILLIHNPFEWA